MVALRHIISIMSSGRLNDVVLTPGTSRDAPRISLEKREEARASKAPMSESSKRAKKKSRPPPLIAEYYSLVSIFLSNSDPGRASCRVIIATISRVTYGRSRYTAQRVTQCRAEGSVRVPIVRPLLYRTRGVYR